MNLRPDDTGPNDSPGSPLPLRRSGMAVAWRVFVPIALAATFSAVSLKYLPVPFLWIAIVWAGVCIVGMIVTRRTVTRAVLLNVAVAILTAGAIEAYAHFVFKGERQVLPLYTPGYRVRDDVLGTAPKKGIAAYSKRVVQGDTVVYDVQYTIEPNGLRIAPPHDPSEVRSCVLFFGCSFTFGEGLDDAQTLPFQVGALSHGKIRTYNFGFHGYGPQQMLAALDHALVDRIVEGKPSHVIYQAIPDHVGRAAGLYPFGRHSPRYRLNADGRVTQAGLFSDDDKSQPSAPVGVLEYQLSKSSVFSWLAARRLGLPTRALNKDDVSLFLGIVVEAKRLVELKFPGCEFHVLLWPLQNQMKIYEDLIRGLRDARIETWLVADVLPDYWTNTKQYQISPYDQHPSAKANTVLAEYALKRIVDK